MVDLESIEAQLKEAAQEVFRVEQRMYRILHPLDKETDLYDEVDTIRRNLFGSRVEINTLYDAIRKERRGAR